MAAAKYHVGDRVEDAETGETGTVVHPLREYVTIVLTGQPYRGGDLLGHLIGVHRVLRAAGGTWRGTAEAEDQRERAMARDVFAFSPPGRLLPLCARVHARPLHLARTCAATSAGLLARNLVQ